MKIGIYKARETRGNTLIINNTRVAGYESGFGYDLIDEFNIKLEDIKRLIEAEEQSQR